jgi:hypothetical protein
LKTWAKIFTPRKKPDWIRAMVSQSQPVLEFWGPLPNTDAAPLLPAEIPIHSLGKDWSIGAFKTFPMGADFGVSCL